MTTEALPLAKFRLGKIVTTPKALEKLTQDDILMGIRRHQAGDWGNVPESDRTENERALCDGLRLLSVYRSARGAGFWLITEADRSVTTVLLLEEISKSPRALRPASREQMQARSLPVSAGIAAAKEISELPKLSHNKSVRSLQIEAVGDSWKKQIKPKIRITGKWLERAGFKPGTRVSLICRELGFIELRAFGSISQSMNLTSADEIQNPS
jgi:hypothetical protein